MRDSYYPFSHGFDVLWLPADSDTEIIATFVGLLFPPARGVHVTSHGFGTGVPPLMPRMWLWYYSTTPTCTPYLRSFLSELPQYDLTAFMQWFFAKTAGRSTAGPRNLL